MNTLERFGFVFPKNNNWGTSILIGHEIKNVSKVIVDQPQKHTGSMHDYIDYRIIIKCEIPNRA